MKAIRTSAKSYASESKRSMSQSERARMQPRDDAGRFASEDYNRRSGVLLFKGRVPTQQELTFRTKSSTNADLIVVDESNSFSGKGDGRRKNLTIVCTRVRDRNKYAAVVGLIPSKKGVRSKYSNSRDSDRRKIVESISDQDIDIVVRHRRIDYRNLPDAESKKKFYLGTLEDAIVATVDIEPNRPVDVLIDSPPLKIDKELSDFGIWLTSTDRDVHWFETKRSASDRYLTVHDFETGVVSDHIEDFNESEPLFEVIKRRVRSV